MPDQLLRSAYIASEGPLVLDGETLIGIIVKDTYVFSTTHTNASEVTAYEVEPVSTESRLTGTCTVILNDAETAWLPLVTGTTAVDLSDVEDRGGIVWVRPGASDAVRKIIGWAADPGPDAAAYLPTWPDGLYAELIAPFDAMSADSTVAGVPFVDGDVDAEDLAAALGGAVDSVNGQTGVVVLDATDVGAPTGSGTSTGTNTGDQDLSALAPKASPTFTGTVSGITAAMVGAPSGSGTSTGTNTGDQTLPTLSSLGAVPTSRTLAGLDLSADRTASALRTALGLVIGTDVLAPNGSGASLTGIYVPGGTDVAVADGGTGASTATAARANLGVGSGVFGSGIDGALVLDGSSAVTGMTRSGTVYTPTRDIIATDLTIQSGVTLDLRTSWRLYANGTFSNAGTVRASGLSATWSTAPSANNWGSLGRGGGAGAGATGAGSAAGSWDGTNKSKLQGNGGAGGLGSSGAGGTSPAQSAAAHEFGAVYGFYTAPGCTSGYTVGNASGTGFPIQLSGGGGGGGGGGDGTNAGGGGGAGANPILIVARYFVNTGTITADGGAGYSPTTGNCGGGGGGGGGAIVISSTTYSNSGTITANGGAGGTKVGTGVNGTTGGNGTIVLVTL